MLLDELILQYSVFLSILLASCFVVGVFCLGFGIWLRIVTQEGTLKAYKYDLVIVFVVLWVFLWLFSGLFHDLSESRSFAPEVYTSSVSSGTR